MMVSIDDFIGFSPETLKFLSELSINNTKAWFEANRSRYEIHLIQPFKALVHALAPAISKIDPELVIQPAVGKTIARIHRDIRFAKDKSPYRPNLWLTFKRAYSPWQMYPGFFFELFPDRWWYGMGFYFANRDTMNELKTFIRQRFRDFHTVLDWQKQHPHLTLRGEEYKRIQAPDAPSEVQIWMQKKNIYFANEGDSLDRLFKSDFADFLKTEFEILAPIYHFLWRFVTI